MSCRVPGLDNMPQNWPPLHFSAVIILLVYRKKQIMRYHEMVPFQTSSLCSNHGRDMTISSDGSAARPRFEFLGRSEPGSKSSVEAILQFRPHEVV